MRPFILLDLYSQADCIPPEVRTWPRHCVLTWMRQFGEVREWPLPSGETAAQFRALSGLTTTFVLSEDGKLSIYIGEHTILAIWN